MHYRWRKPQNLNQMLIETTEITQKWLITLTSIMRRTLCGSSSCDELLGRKPALFTKILTIPISLLISLFTSSMLHKSATST